MLATKIIDYFTSFDVLMTIIVMIFKKLKYL